jgi:hypothetical protein
MRRAPDVTCVGISDNGIKPCDSVVASFSGNWRPLVSIRGWMLLFLAEFLESGIRA